MKPNRAALRALLPFALHASARELDRALWLPLRSDVVLEAPLAAVAGGLAPLRLLASLALWLVVGAVLWLLLARLRSGRENQRLDEALQDTASGFWPLLLRPALSLLALIALALRPAYPYGFTLPIALTQDWSAGQDLLSVAALLAVHGPFAVRRVRVPAPGAASLFLMAFVGYGLLSPGWSRHWDGHPGNEPKTLRQAVALGHGLTLDAEEVSDAMERLEVTPLGQAAGRAAATVVAESGAMLVALASDPVGAFSPDAIRATRITRQTVRGKDGGVFYVLAPGPSLVLAPGLRADRWINSWRGTEGRLGATLLLWNALAAALVASMFLLARSASGRAGIAALVAAGFGLAPPFLFYAYQFYPEMLGALVLCEVLRRLAFERHASTARLALLGALIATLPWLHQKFLPVWGLLSLAAVVLAVERLVSWRGVLALVLPQALTLYLTALYNFAVTGSPRPDALFLAWGPGGVTGARVGEGALGLAFDARFGLLPFAPAYALGLAALALPGRLASRLRWMSLPLLAYYATVAAADNWSGATSNLGRYAMPVLPLLVAGCAVLLRALGALPGVRLLAGFLAGWTLLLAAALFADPHAANDCAVLLAHSVFADGHVYVPDLFFRSARYLAAGHAARVASWVALAGLLVAALRRAAVTRSALRPAPAFVLVVVVSLGLGLWLERWPASRDAPGFRDAIAVGDHVAVFAPGAAVTRGEFVEASGRVRLAVRASELPGRLVVVAEGAGRIEAEGVPSVLIPPSGTRFAVPLRVSRALAGRGGAREEWAEIGLDVSTPGTVYLRFDRE